MKRLGLFGFVLLLLSVGTAFGGGNQHEVTSESGRPYAEEYSTVSTVRTVCTTCRAYVPWYYPVGQWVGFYYVFEGGRKVATAYTPADPRHMGAISVCESLRNSDTRCDREQPGN